VVEQLTFNQLVAGSNPARLIRIKKAISLEMAFLFVGTASAVYYG
jgi:hypothetical protein